MFTENEISDSIDKFSYYLTKSPLTRRVFRRINSQDDWLYSEYYINPIGDRLDYEKFNRLVSVLESRSDRAKQQRRNTSKIIEKIGVLFLTVDGRCVSSSKGEIIIGDVAVYRQFANETHRLFLGYHGDRGSKRDTILVSWPYLKYVPKIYPHSKVHYCKCCGKILVGRWREHYYENYEPSIGPYRGFGRDRWEFVCFPCSGQLGKLYKLIFENIDLIEKLRSEANARSGRKRRYTKNNQDKLGTSGVPVRVIARPC